MLKFNEIHFKLLSCIYNNSFFFKIIFLLEQLPMFAIIEEDMLDKSNNFFSKYFVYSSQSKYAKLLESSLTQKFNATHNFCIFTNYTENNILNEDSNNGILIFLNVLPLILIFSVIVIFLLNNKFTAFLCNFVNFFIRTFSYFFYLIISKRIYSEIIFINYYSKNTYAIVFWYSVLLISMLIFHYLYIKLIFSHVSFPYDQESIKVELKLLVSKILSLFIFIFPKKSGCFYLDKFKIISSGLFVFYNILILINFTKNYQKITKINFRYNSFRFKVLFSFNTFMFFKIIEKSLNIEDYLISCLCYVLYFLVIFLESIFIAKIIEIIHKSKHEVWIDFVYLADKYIELKERINSPHYKKILCEYKKLFIFVLNSHQQIYLKNECDLKCLLCRDKNFRNNLLDLEFINKFFLDFLKQGHNVDIFYKNSQDLRIKCMRIQFYIKPNDNMFLYEICKNLKSKHLNLGERLFYQFFFKKHLNKDKEKLETNQIITYFKINSIFSNVVDMLDSLIKQNFDGNEFNVLQITENSKIIYKFKKKIQYLYKLISPENKLYHNLIAVQFKLIFNTNIEQNCKMDERDLDFLEENFSKINYFVIKYNLKENNLYIKNTNNKLLKIINYDIENLNEIVDKNISVIFPPFLMKKQTNNIIKSFKKKY